MSVARIHRVYLRVRFRIVPHRKPTPRVVHRRNTQVMRAVKATAAIPSKRSCAWSHSTDVRLSFIFRIVMHHRAKHIEITVRRDARAFCTVAGVSVPILTTMLCPLNVSWTASPLPPSSKTPCTSSTAASAYTIVDGGDKDAPRVAVHQQQRRKTKLCL